MTARKRQKSCEDEYLKMWTNKTQIICMDTSYGPEHYQTGQSHPFGGFGPSVRIQGWNKDQDFRDFNYKSLIIWIMKSILFIPWTLQFCVCTFYFLTCFFFFNEDFLSKEKSSSALGLWIFRQSSVFFDYSAKCNSRIFSTYKKWLHDVHASNKCYDLEITNHVNQDAQSIYWACWI